MDLTRYSWEALTRVLPQTLPVFYQSNPHLSFAPREIQKIEVTPQSWELTLNFMGLQGASTPLPIHFSERIIQDDPEDSNLNDFYNFFNQQNYKILLGITRKYAYLPQVTQAASDPLSAKLFAFAGFFKADEDREAFLPFLFCRTGRNLEKSSWCRMIARLFNCDSAWVVERVPLRLAIPHTHLSRLGQQSCLGETLSLGAYITEAKNHMELHLKVECLEDFLPNQPLFQKLKSRVETSLVENLFVSVWLHAKKARTATLSFADPVGLGWSTRMGKEAVESYSVSLRLL